MVECNNDAERHLRIQRTLQRLVKATAELEAPRRPKVSTDLPPFAPRDPRTPLRTWDHL